MDESRAERGPFERSGADGPLVSIIVVNWNGAGFVDRCVDSLLGQRWRATEVIVVDNGSVDDSVSLLEGRYGDRIQLVRLDSNRGFAGGANAGIGVATGEWIALINNDAVADPGWVESLVRCGEQSGEIGMCASKIYLAGQDGLLDGAGLLLSRDGIGRGRGRLERDGAQYDEESEVLVPSGCAAFYRSAMLREIGLFDEDFFAYCEDSDLGLRGRLAGWRCRYAPRAIVHHDYSRSTSPYSSFKAFHVERNRIWVVVKCFPAPDLMVSVAYTVARYLMQTFGVLVGKGSAARLRNDAPFWTLPWTVVSAWWHALGRFGDMWVRRRSIQARRRVPAREFRRWMRDHGIGLRQVAMGD